MRKLKHRKVNNFPKVTELMSGQAKFEFEFKHSESIEVKFVTAV